MESIPDLVPEESDDEKNLSKSNSENGGKKIIADGDDEYSLRELYFHMTCVDPIEILQ